jgi:hypothetical protein
VNGVGSWKVKTEGGQTLVAPPKAAVQPKRPAPAPTTPKP